MLRRGFSLIELVVAMGISLIFGLVIFQAIDAASTTTRATLESTQSAASARATLDELTRSLRSARSLGECRQNNPNLTGRCTLADRPFALAWADSNCVVFYGYGSGDLVTEQNGPNPVSSVRVPDLISAYYQGGITQATELIPATGELTVNRYAPTNPSEYTTSNATAPKFASRPQDLCTSSNGNQQNSSTAWNSAPYRSGKSDRLALKDGSTGVFTYLDACGTVLAPAKLVKNGAEELPKTKVLNCYDSFAGGTEDRRSVRLIRFQAELPTRTGRVGTTTPVNLTVDLPASSFSEEVS